LLNAKLLPIETAATSECIDRKAAEAALRDAKPQSQNAFKIELAKRCLTHALLTAAQG